MKTCSYFVMAATMAITRIALTHHSLECPQETGFVVPVIPTLSTPDIKMKPSGHRTTSTMPEGSTMDLTKKTKVKRAQILTTTVKLTAIQAAIARVAKAMKTAATLTSMEGKVRFLLGDGSDACGAHNAENGRVAQCLRLLVLRIVPTTPAHVVAARGTPCRRVHAVCTKSICVAQVRCADSKTRELDTWPGLRRAHDATAASFFNTKVLRICGQRRRRHMCRAVRCTRPCGRSVTWYTHNHPRCRSIHRYTRRPSRRDCLRSMLLDATGSRTVPLSVSPGLHVLNAPRLRSVHTKKPAPARSRGQSQARAPSRAAHRRQLRAPPVPAATRGIASPRHR